MSKIPLKPLADYVVLKQEEAKTKTATGLFLPDKAGEKPKIATVVAVGPQVTDVAVGDKVVYGGYSFNEVKVDSQDYLLIKLDSIFAVIA